MRMDMEQKRAVVRRAREMAREVERLRLRQYGAGRALRVAMRREVLRAWGYSPGPSCALCTAHYRDNGPCDEGKPVASPHRSV